MQKSQNAINNKIVYIKATHDMFLQKAETVSEFSKIGASFTSLPWSPQIDNFCDFLQKIFQGRQTTELFNQIFYLREQGVTKIWRFDEQRHIFSKNNL